MTRFNLSEWAVNNKAIVVFLMLLCAMAGVAPTSGSAARRTRFHVQTMVVQVAWPGATALDTLKQVTDRLEKKLEETPNLDYLKSYTKPGQATIFVYLKESTPKRDLSDLWYQVRKKVSDVQATLPKGELAPSSTMSSATSSASSTASPTASRRARRRDFAESRPSSCARRTWARSRSSAIRTRRSISTSRRRSSRSASSASMTC